MIRPAAVVGRSERIQRVNSATFLRETCKNGRADTSRRGIADTAVTTRKCTVRVASLSSHVHGGRLASSPTVATEPGSIAVPQPIIRPARPDEYDQVARVWMESWVSTGLEDASDSLLAKLRARVPMEIEKGWSLYVADDNGVLAAMLALHVPNAISTSCLWRRNIRATAWGAGCSLLRANTCRMKSGCAACARTKRPGAGTSAKALRSRKNGRIDERPRDEILSMAEIGLTAVARLADGACTL